MVGEQIPLAARILRLADVFDALTTSRSYRHSLTCEEARDLMREDTGAFDPVLFEHFERLFPQFVEMANFGPIAALPLQEVAAMGTKQDRQESAPLSAPPPFH